MSDPEQEILEKVDSNFPSNEDKLRVLEDAASICQRQLWTASPEVKAEYGKVLPDILDRETAMWVRAIANSYIWVCISKVLRKDYQDNPYTEVHKALEKYKSHTDLLEEYSRHTILSVDATGKTNKTVAQRRYTIPDDVRELLTQVRRNGKLLGSNQFEPYVCKECNLKAPDQIWKNEGLLWTDRLKRQSDTAKWPKEEWLSFRLAVFHAWVFHLEVKFHQAKMTILLHQIMSSSKDDEVTYFTKKLLLRSTRSTSNLKDSDEAEEWMSRNDNQISVLKPLRRQHYSMPVY